jgi:ectoine hydroxylase-related dioxygenase (phytanoyl-CoA dioxygenase family)
MSGLITLGPDANVEEVCAVIDRDGGVILSDFVGQATLDGLWEDLGPRLNNVGWGQDKISGSQTRRLGSIFKHTKHIADVALQPQYFGASERILRVPHHLWYGEERVEIRASMQVGVTQAIQIHPGQGAQPLHRDDNGFQWKHIAGTRQARVQVMVAMSDFTKENGGTLVVPGSHKWGDDRPPRLEEAVSTEMAAGSALLWIGATFHGGGVNTSDAPRTGLTMAYDLGYLRQEENQYLAVPLEVVRQYPENLQRLLGYGASEPFMGWIEIDGVMADPHAVLEDELSVKPVAWAMTD